MVLTWLYDNTVAFDRYFRNNGDKRVADMTFMDSPWKVILLSIFYVYFSYDLGPNRLMKNRQAFNLVWTVRIFNTMILTLNVWLLSNYFVISNWGLDHLGCSPVDETDTSAEALDQLNICHIFLYSRILELIDTVWICLRKKNRQITFLHVFHHSFVLLMTWFYFRLAPGGSSTMFPIVNGMVHVVMYLYYILSTFESLKPYLWWKKYVTRIQMMQFIVLHIHFVVAALTPNCAYPPTLSITGALIAGMFFCLFAGFYKETYVAEQRLLKQKTIEAQQRQQQQQQQQQHQKLNQTIYDKNNNTNNNNNNSSTNNRNNKLLEAKNK